MPPSFYSHNSAFKKIPSEQQSSFSLTPQILFSLINLQFNVTRNLLSNQDLLKAHFRKDRQTTDSSQSSGSNFAQEEKVEGQKSSNSQFLQIEPLEDIEDGSSEEMGEDEVSIKQVRLRKRRRVSYRVDEEDSDQEVKRCIKKSETKNIIKNYMKSFFNEIKNHSKLIEHVAQISGNNAQELLNEIMRINGNINTITELRQLWGENAFAEAFRVLSNYYFRRKYLKHIFNSRVNNHFIHLKYRRRFMELLRNPHNISGLKDS